MPPFAHHANVDPLHSFMAGARVAGTQNPIPLVGTRFDVAIRGGFATVSTKRTFRNCEAASIEATITFPVPVHAVLFSLEARIGGRLLKACAQRKGMARAAYEAAIERGKTAVLHEEVLRGVHMLSVGHIAPGADIEVTATWAISLTNINGAGHLRIPLTVGDIYGCSGLPDSDELIHGGSVQTGQLSVECVDGAVTRLGRKCDAGPIDVPLNAPIDLEVTGWQARELHGRAADGRGVVLRIEPLGVSDGAVDIALAIDHSGSMGEVCSSAHPDWTKHEAVSIGLQAVASSLRPSDTVDVWEFDNALKHIGGTRDRDSKRSRESTEPGRRLTRLVRMLSAPSGGTEIGAALSGIAARSKAQDILLITDGKSHALDVQALARTGRRFSVVLIGEDSLEANVGHLAAITGGEIFVASNGNLDGTLASALASLRTPHKSSQNIVGVPSRIEVNRGNMRLTAQWHPAGEPSEGMLGARAASAIAASIALPSLDSETATQLAEAEGLVTHLTSLILVDEAGEVQSGIPANRKIALPSPMMAAYCAAPMGFAGICDSISFNEDHAPQFLQRSVVSKTSLQRPRRLGLFGRRSGRNAEGLAEERAIQCAEQAEDFHRAQLVPLLSALAQAIDWDLAPSRLQAGDLSALDEGVAREVLRLAHRPEFVEFARYVQIEPIILIIGLIAQRQSSSSRTAARIAKAILRDRLEQDLVALLD